jgi:hypothetical protein
MHRIHRTLRGPSVLPNTQRNRAVLFRTCFTTIWRSEINISLKVDTDDLNRRRRRFHQFIMLRRIVKFVSEIAVVCITVRALDNVPASKCTCISISALGIDFKT